MFETSRRGPGKNDVDFLLLLVYIFGFIDVAQAVLNAVRTRLRFNLQAALMYDLPSRLYDWLMRLPLPFVERRPIPDIQRKLNAVQRSYMASTAGWVDIAIDSVFAVIFLVLMFMANATLSVVITGLFLLFVAARLLTLPVLERSQTEIMQSEIDRETHSLLALSSLEQIKIFGIEGKKTSEWQNAHSLAVASHISQESLMEYLKVLHGIVLNACMLALAYWGATAVLQGKATVGGLFAFALYKDSFMRLVLSVSSASRTSATAWPMWPASRPSSTPPWSRTSPSRWTPTTWNASGRSWPRWG